MTNKNIQDDADSDSKSDVPPYLLRISRLTIDKLGVKLYDKASAVVAELVSNGYDADAENVTVRIPLGIQLASQAGGELQDKNLVIEVDDDGHGMTPQEARDFFLRVGADRRTRPGGEVSRNKKRPVMGRKGIGKLAPFGICKRIEVWSAGGKKTSLGYQVTHFFMNFDDLLKDQDSDVPLIPGDEDHTYSENSGTRIRLTSFLAKRVPDEETFHRQLAMRFVFARPDFSINITDTSTENPATKKVNPLEIPLLPGSRIELENRPVITDEGVQLPVKGWLAMAQKAYKNDEMKGVRIYARNKIVGVTRDFEQPAGFTGEFAVRSYLVGQVEAEWLDLDEGEDLVRTDRQDILWDSDYGRELRKWGSELIKEVAKRSNEPRRERVRDEFMERSNLKSLATERYGDRQVAKVAVELGKKLGGFAAEDQLADDEYVADLTQIILSVAPHQALLEAFHDLRRHVDAGEIASIDQLTEVFDKARVAELAAYAQIAAQRVKVIHQLRQIIDDEPDEAKFQSLLAQAEWLIEPTWTVITKNQSLKSFKHAFEQFWKKRTGEDVTLAIEKQTKRPDFTLISIGRELHIVEIKRAGHHFDDADWERLNNYVDAFEDFFDSNPLLKSEFNGWKIHLIVDGINLKSSAKRAFEKVQSDGNLEKVTWRDFLLRTEKAHEQFLEAQSSALKTFSDERST